MATRGWGGPIALALGIAGGIAAAELGMGYGLDIITWPTATDAAGERSWLASLAWTTWLAATATVLGAIAADALGRTGRVARAGATLAGTAQRLTLCLAAAIGGLLTVPLVAVPARATHRPETYAPQVIAGGYAVVGVVIGLLVAIAALHSRAIAINLCASGGWLWALAIAAASYGVRKGESGAQLATWHFGSGHFLRETFSLPGAALMLGMAALLGVLVSIPALRRGDNRVGVALSGAFGPLLVAVAYFLAAPKLSDAQPDDQLSAYLIAPYAVIAGLAGSVAVVTLAMRREQARSSAGHQAALPVGDDADPPAQPRTLPTQPTAESVDRPSMHGSVGGE